MELKLIIANIFAFLAALFMAGGTSLKTKKKIVGALVISDLFFIIANLISWSLSAAIVNTIAIVRDYMVYHKKFTRPLNAILITAVIAIGLFVNTRGLIGLLPIIATVQYGLIVRRARYPQLVRFSILIATLLWSVHDLSIGLFAPAPIYLMSIIIIARNLLQYRRPKRKASKRIARP